MCKSITYFGASGVVKEVAVISMIGHFMADVLFHRFRTSNPAIGFLQGQQLSLTTQSTTAHQTPSFMAKQ